MSGGSSIDIDGAIVRSIYVQREVKVYAIHESDVQQIGGFNTQASIFVGVGAALVSYAVGIWTNASFAERLTPLGEAASTVLAPIIAALGFLSLGLASWAIYRRSAIWSEVGSKSTPRIKT